MFNFLSPTTTGHGRRVESLKRLVSYPGIVLEDEGRDVDLLGSDAGEELLQAVQVTHLVLDPRHAEGGEEPRRRLRDEQQTSTF